MRKIIFAATMVALATGCSGSEEIWVFYVDGASDPVNTRDITHNFNGAVPINNGTTTGDWTNTYTQNTSPSIVFGQIVKVSGEDDAFLIMGDNAIPGQKSGGAWIFTWNDVEQTTDRDQHITGFYSEIFRDSTTTTTLTMDLAGGTATGGITTRGSGVTTYRESDTWDPNAVNRFGSEIPAGSYLEDEFGGYVENAYELTDCTGGECWLTITDTVDVTSNFRAERTKYSEEDAFSSVGSATEPN